MAKAIGDKGGQALTAVERDRDTPDGGKQGEVTCNPKEIDGIIKRAWMKIHNGVVANIEGTIDNFLNTYVKYCAKAKEYQVKELTAQRVYESFTKTKDSAGSLDGWRPKEFRLLSLNSCGWIAQMLNQVEEGGALAEISTANQSGLLGKGRSGNGKNHEL